MHGVDVEQLFWLTAALIPVKQSSPFSFNNNEQNRTEDFFFPFSGNLAKCQKAELPLSVECGAQLFACSLARPGAIAALIFSSGTGRISRRRRLGYQSSRDTNHSHRGAYRRGVRVCMCV